MLNKVSAVARLVAIVLAIVAGFMPELGFNVALVLVVLGLVAGITMPADRYVAVGVTVVALPMVAVALANIPVVGTQLGAVAGGLALFAAGSLASALVMILVTRSREDIGGLGK